jgi:hypothetical protein
VSRTCVTASRSEFGKDSPLVAQAFEIEALDPVELRQLVRDAIEPLIDRDAWAESLTREEDERAQIRRGTPWVSP